MLSDEFSMIEAAGANMAVDGREGDNDGRFVLRWKEFVHEFCERVC